MNLLEMLISGGIRFPKSLQDQPVVYMAEVNLENTNAHSIRKRSKSWTEEVVKKKKKNGSGRMSQETPYRRLPCL
jgi:hypothetical protein